MPVSTLLDEHALACDPKFGTRVRMACTRVAREVLAEVPTTPGNPLRVSLARTVLVPNDFTSPGLAPVIASDPGISATAAGRADSGSAQAAVTDEQILGAVRSAWNAIAGFTDTPGSQMP
ncbi:hypothetical protein ACIQCR_17170 [Streptomyces sp. NPDC093249]|uniref:hypothetical protein n=1 Tax=unclassified Streptomyces TaxID=2593676 RepID=UPI00344C8310